MAERTLVVCDVCGAPAAETVALRIRGRSLQKDLCETHLTELAQGARSAKRGRPRAKAAGAAAATPAKTARPARRRSKNASGKAA